MKWFPSIQSSIEIKDLSSTKKGVSSFLLLIAVQEALFEQNNMSDYKLIGNQHVMPNNAWFKRTRSKYPSLVTVNKMIHIQIGWWSGTMGNHLSSTRIKVTRNFKVICQSILAFDIRIFRARNAKYGQSIISLTQPLQIEKPASYFYC